MDLTVVYVAPIPVGHRVRVRFYDELLPGLGGGPPRRDERPHQPEITDLDTGIVYATDWIGGAGRRSHPDAPYDVGVTPLQDRHLASEVTGAVRACRVVTIRGYPDLEVQTQLDIDED